MRIIKRDYSYLALSINIWTIPLFTYLLQKSSGVINPNREWYWYVAISLTFVLWLRLNYKIVKNK